MTVDVNTIPSSPVRADAPRSSLRPGPARAPRRGVLERLARLPLLYKILAANAAIVMVGAVAGTGIALQHGARHPGAPHYELIAGFILAGIGASVLANFLVLRAVLRPLEHLQHAVDAVQAGQAGVRVERSGPTDERFEHLADTFDQMIRTLEDSARRLQHLPRQILHAQEEERRRIARELHDQAAQSLTSLLVRLRLLDQAQRPAEIKAKVMELRELTVRALNDVRRIALELRPSVLDDLGLVDALQGYVDDLNAAGPTRVTFRAEGLHGRLPGDIELAFYRVAQEALSNALRHARATGAQVRLRQDGARLTLEVKDDGVGFEPAQAGQAAGGLGLAGMRERMSLIGGAMAIRSIPGKGTIIAASVDLPRAGA